MSENTKHMIEIPINIVNFLSKTIVIHIGTHDDKLFPWETMAFGQKVGDDRKSVTVYFSNDVAEKTISNLKSNGKIAVTFAEPASHECYQFKGKYQSHRQSSEDETIIQDQFMQNLNMLFENFGKGPAFFSPVKYKPSIALTFTVEQIYVQTPGPDAGKQIL